MTPDDLVGLYSQAPDPPPLRELADVDWATVSHAYGSATDVPALLRAFVSDVPDHREFATELLFQTVWHSGTVYDATASVVPFLYKLLAAEGVPDKARVAHLIGTVADGRSYLDCHARTPNMVATWRSILAKDGKTLEAELARELGHVAAVRRAVAAGLDALYPYLHDPEPVTRRTVAVALGMFPEHAARSLPELRAAMRDEPEEDARELLAEAIQRLVAAGGHAERNALGDDVA